MYRTLSALALLASAGCATYLPAAAPPDPTTTLAETPAAGAVEGRIVLGTPAQLPGHSTCLVPLARVVERRWWRDQDPFREGGLAASGASGAGTGGSRLRTWDRSARWHNALFRDLATGESWTLLGQRGVVSRWWMLLEVAGAEPTSRAIVYAVTLDDTNGDGVLDDRDAARALVTAGDGRGARLVTPADGQLAGVVYAADGRHAFLMVREDDDGDREFEREEAVTPWVVDLADQEIARPLLEGEAVERAAHLLDG